MLKAFAMGHAPPFAELAWRPTSTNITCLGLETMNGVPYVILVRHGEEVILQNLETGMRSFLHVLPTVGAPDRPYHNVSLIYKVIHLLN